MTTFKIKILSAIWFGVSGFLTVLLATSISHYIYSRSSIHPQMIPSFYNLLLQLRPMLCTFIAALVGFFYGYRIFSLTTRSSKNLLKSIGIGFLGGLFSFLIVVLWINLRMAYLVYSANCQHTFSSTACQTAFHGSGKFILITLMAGLLQGGWVALLMGIISAVILYRVVSRN